MQARRHVCRKGLPRIEERLRTVQMEDSLENVPHILKVKTRMVQFKNKNICGQHQGTRLRTIIDWVHGKAWAAAIKYNSAHVAKLELSGSGDWMKTYQHLNDSDICGYQDPNRLQIRTGHRGTLEDNVEEDNADAPAVQGGHGTVHDTPADPSADAINLFDDDRTRWDGTGESRRTLSWIWLDIMPSNIDGVADEEDEEDITLSEDILQAKWAKSRARATRWTEKLQRR